MPKLHALYFTLISATFLVGSINGFIWNCKSDTDCTSDNSYCTKVGLCECKDGQIFSTDGKECLPLASGPTYACRDNRQCTDFIFGPVSCTREVCQCDKGYRYLSAISSCVPFKNLYEPCNEDIECFDDIDVNSMKCKDNTCVCNDGYYNRGAVDCRLKSKESQVCLFDVDCQSKTLYCKTEYSAFGVCARVGVSRSTNITDKAEEIIAEVNVTETPDTKLDIPCNGDTECTTEHSICSSLTKKCACIKSYYYNAVSKTCVPTVGQQCTDKCVTNAECVNGKCQCKPYYISGYLDGKCYKPASNVGNSCTDDKNCYSLGRYAQCTDKKCVCQLRKFDNKSMTCVLEASIGDTCKKDEHCILDQTECNYEECVCKKDYKALDNQTCSLELGQSCKNNEKYCKIPYASCNSDEKCACDERFLQSDKLKCVPELTNVTHRCIADVQCTDLLTDVAYCDNTECKCKDEYLLRNETCFLKRYMGDSCRSQLDCELILNGHVRCKNSLCTCADEYKYIEQELRCVPISGSVSIYQGFSVTYALIIACTIYGFLF